MYGLHGSNLAIGVSLVLRDQFTGRARAAAASINQLDRQTRQAQMRQLEMQRNINAVGAGIGLVALNSMRQWAKVGMEFGYTMNYVKEIAEKKGGIGLEQLSDRAKTLGADTMFTGRQVGDAMRYMAMAGQDTQAIYENIAAAVDLAGATMSRLEGKGGTADIMTNIMRGFNISASEKNSRRVADVLTTATTSANTNLWDLHEAMKYSISTAKDLNVTLEETAAMVMMAGDAGIQGSMAGTATENMLRYVTRAVDETRKGRQGQALARLGLSKEALKDAQGNLLAISPMLSVISKQIQGMDNVRSQNILTDIFGVRGKREASLLLRNMEQFDTYINKLNTKAGGSAARIMKSQMETPMGLAKQLTSAWEMFQISFTEAITPILIPALKVATTFVKTLSSLVQTPVGKVLTMMATGFAVIKTVSMGYKAIMLSLRLLHIQMGTTFASSSSGVVSGYNRMTAAAARYRAAAGGAASGGPMQVGVKGERFYDKRTGRFVSMAEGRKAVRAQKWAKANKLAGRYGGVAAIAGMGLSMAGNNVEGILGKAMGIGGSALGMAGTGAMLGSVIPGVGTAVGAIVGGVGSLLWDLYNELTEVSDEVDKVKSKTKGEEAFDAERWKIKAMKLQSMYEGQFIYGKGLNHNDMWATSREGANQTLHPGSQYVQPNRIIINIDGKKAMDEVVKENNYKTLLSLAAF